MVHERFPGTGGMPFSKSDLTKFDAKSNIMLVNYMLYGTVLLFHGTEELI